jgi:hypothetical protein
MTTASVYGILKGVCNLVIGMVWQDIQSGTT